MFVEPPRAYKKHWKRSEAVWTTRCRRPLDKTPVPFRVAMSFLKSFVFLIVLPQITCTTGKSRATERLDKKKKKYSVTTLTIFE